jgi:hypothetical protein
MRRPSTRLAGMAGALLALVAFTGSTQANPGDDVHFFEASVESRGSAFADFGEERKRPGQITASGVDGVEALSWRWEVRAVAASVGAGPLVTRAKAGRSRAVLTTSIVSYGIQNGKLGETQLCDQNAGTTTFLSNDGAGRPAKKSGPGEFVHSAYFRLYGGELSTSPPGGSSHSCFHNPTEGGGKFVEGVREDDARVRRGAFNPRSDRSYERVYPSTSSLDLSHGGDPNSAHTFDFTSRLKVTFEAISKRRFNKLVRKYQNIPVNLPGSGETEYHDPPE